MPADHPDSFVEHLRKFQGDERCALQVGALSLTYANLLRLVDSTAEQLREAGITARDRVLIMMPNSAEHIVAVLAVLSVDAIAVPLDADAGVSRQTDVLGQTMPRLCLACMATESAAGLQTLRMSVSADDKSAEFLLEGSPPSAPPIVSVDKPVAFIRFTSGSSGHAKGVEITHAQQLWTARMLSDCFGLGAEHRELILVSMALSGGWQRVAATLYGGGCVLIGEKPLSVGDLLDMLVSTQATGFFTPPPLVRMLLASPADKVRAALRACTTLEIGSAAVGADELQALTALLPDTRVFFHYGLTECSRAVILDASRHPDHLATVGRPSPGVDIRIVDEQRNDLPGEQDGQILLRGPQLTSGYWQRPDLNHERFVDGWLTTGDYGSVDQQGFLTLRGRHDDMINCGGHCYFPDEVEQALGTPAGVDQYLVAGVPDPRGVLQDVPWAFVVPIDADGWSPQVFLKQARDNLPAHMVPRQVVVVPSLPLTPSGKPDRRETAKLYARNT